MGVSSDLHKLIIEKWQALDLDRSETELEEDLVKPILDNVGIEIYKTTKSNHISLINGGSCKPDRQIFVTPDKPPILTIENKRRVSLLANASDSEFENLVLSHKLYQEAVEQIKLYLNADEIPPDSLSKYGLVFNGDFFQFWRRIDALVLPLTPVKRVTAETIPNLMKLLQYILKNPRRALITGIWNQKGGVAKTTNTINVSGALAIQGKRVLLIDLDEQCDLTRGLGLNPANHSEWFIECANRLQAQEIEEAKIIIKRAIQKRIFPVGGQAPFPVESPYALDILPNHDKALSLFRENNMFSINQIKIFQRLIEIVAPYYDYIFIDTSPTPDILTNCVLYSVDTVSIPVDYGKKSIHHAVRIYNLLSKIRENRKKQDHLYWGPWNLGLVYSNCPPDAGTKLDQYMNNEFTAKGFQGIKCKTRIQSFAQTRIAEYKHVPVTCWVNSPVSKLYFDLINELFLRHNFIKE